MKFGIINPVEAKAEIVDLDDLDAAYAVAGLERGKVDFGSLSQHLACVVYEFGLFADESIGYFSIGQHLFAGSCVLFACDDEGETVDLEKMPPVKFYGRSAASVERAIRWRQVQRPETSVNGQVLWKWSPVTIGDNAPMHGRR